jgi:hypothetical protein
MTSRERLLTVIQGGIPDRVPVTVHQWQDYHLKHFMGGLGDLEAFKQCGLDAVCYPGAASRNPPAPDWKVTVTQKDRGDGTQLKEMRVETPGGVLTEIGVQTEYTYSATGHLVRKSEDIELIDKYMPVPEVDPGIARAFAAEIGEHGILRMFTNGPQGSPWQDACCYCGTEPMIYHAMEEPDWTHQFLEILLKKKLEFYKKNLPALKGAVSMIETGGGAASNTVISPAMFKEFCLPYDIRQHAVIHEIDPSLAISYHTCGGMMKILDLIPQNGCNFSETLSPVGCGGDIKDNQDEPVLKKTLGGKVKLMGGINQIQVLTSGTREQIYKEVERCFKGYGQGGGQRPFLPRAQGKHPGLCPGGTGNWGLLPKLSLTRFSRPFYTLPRICPSLLNTTKEPFRPETR